MDRAPERGGITPPVRRGCSGPETGGLTPRRSPGDSNDRPRHIPGRRPAGFNAFFADGSHCFIGSDTDEETIRGLITGNGGEKVDLSELD
jgi:hypothetical protein